MDKSKEKLRLDIDKRNEYANKHYGKVVTNDFSIEDYINETINSALDNEYYKGLCDGYINLILHFIMKNAEDDALSQLLKTEQLIDAYNLDELQTMDLYRAYFMYYYESIGDYEAAIQYIKKALVIAEKFNDKKVIMRLKSNLGVINSELGFYEVALELLKDSIIYSEATNDDFHIMYDYNNIADVYYYLGNLKLSEFFYIKAHDLAIKANEIAIIQDSCIGLSRLYTKGKEFKKASEILTDTIKYASNNNATRFEVETIIALSKNYIVQGKYDNALSELMKAEKKSVMIEHRSILMELYKLISEVASQTANYKKAYESIIKYNEFFEEASNLKSEKLLNNILRNEYKKNIAKLEAIATVGRELNTLKDLDEVLIEVTAILSEYMSINSIGIGRLKGTEIIYDHFFTDGKKNQYKTLSVDDESSLAAWAIRHEKPIIVNDIEQDYRIYTSKPLIRFKRADDKEIDLMNSIMYMPLIVKNKTVGVFTIQSYQKHAYSNEDMEIFKIVSSYTAIALINITQSEIFERLSITDSLTDMLNRRGFTEWYNRLTENNSNSDMSIAMIMMDLDFFKDVNDQYGHITGDLVLKSVADVLKGVEDDLICVARLGGEEFGVIVSDASLQNVIDLAEKIRMQIESLVLTDGDDTITITASFGVSHNKLNADSDFKTYYHEADRAMYIAKHSGRNKVVLFNEKDTD